MSNQVLKNNQSKKWKIARTSLLAAMILSLVFTSVSFAAGNQNRNSNAKVKNVIVLIADGAGFNTWTAADYYQYGETGMQVYEDFPTQLAVSTNNVDYQYSSDDSWSTFLYGGYGSFVTDSAAAATAMATGVKTSPYVIGMGPAPDYVVLDNVIEFAEALGKSTGVISTQPFSHATPAGFVAHNVSRNNYAEIANEMIYESGVEVIMGVGAPDYDDDGISADPLLGTSYVGGDATWADITDDGMVGDLTVIRTRADFQAMAEGDTPTGVLGIPMVHEQLQYRRSRGDGPYIPYSDPLIETVPTLEEMTKAALNVLDNNENGFLIMIEGGSVDYANHEAGYWWMGVDATNSSKVRMLEEMVDFNKSVEAAVKWVEENSNWGETMIIITADHETGNLWGPDSGTDPDTGEPIFNAIVNNGAGEVPGMQHYDWYHTKRLVPIFAKGAAARLFKGYADEEDPVYGPYIQNTDIHDVIIQSLK